MLYLADDKHLYKTLIKPEDYTHAKEILRVIRTLYETEGQMSIGLLYEALDKDYIPKKFEEGRKLEELLPDSNLEVFETLDEKDNRVSDKISSTDFYVFQHFVIPNINFDTIYSSYNLDELSELRKKIIKMGVESYDEINFLFDQSEIGRDNVNVLKRVNKVPNYINKK